MERLTLIMNNLIAYITSLVLFLENASLALEELGFFLGGRLTDLFTEKEM